MRRFVIAFAILVTFSLGGIWLSCSRDNTVVPVDRPTEVEGDAGAALFEWAIGPIEGITTAWHPAPSEITVPVGTTLRLKCGSVPSSGIHWSNAQEVSRGDFGSIAECHIDAPGRHEISVAVVDGRTWQERIQEFSDDAVGGEDIQTLSFRRTCIVNGVDVGVDHVGVVALEPRVTPCTLTESSSNYETMKAFRAGNTISQFRQVWLDRYSTAVNRPIALGARLSDPRFTSIIETRISGQRPLLGVEMIEIQEPGRHTVSVGPPSKAQSFVVETYEVSITSHQRGRDAIPDGEPTTFVAKTEPPGHEDEITWLSSTRRGEAHPVIGHGASFTVTFQSASRGDSWLGVRADNATFTVDAFLPCDCPDQTPPPTLQVKDTKTSLYPDPLPSTPGPPLAPVATISAELKGPGEGECCVGGAMWQIRVIASSAIPGGNSGTTADFLCGEGPFTATTVFPSGIGIACLQQPTAGGCPPAPPAPSTRTSVCTIPITCYSAESPWPCTMLQGPYKTVFEMGGNFAGKVEVHWTASLGASTFCVMPAPTGSITGIYHMRKLGDVWYIYDPIQNMVYIPISGPAGDCDGDGISNYDEVIAGTNPGDCPDDEAPISSSR